VFCLQKYFDNLVVQDGVQNSSTSPPTVASSTCDEALSDVFEIGFDETECKQTTERDTETDVELSNCCICGEVMYPEQELSAFLTNSVSHSEQRALSCMSGHTFCTSCWAQHFSIQISENQSGFLPCCGYKCGEYLDLQWANILFAKSSELLEKLMSNRRRLIVDCAGWRHCSHEGCGLIVCLPTSSKRIRERELITAQSPAAATQDSTLPERENLPQSSLCANGHMFCVQCSQSAHSPLSCVGVTRWQQFVREELAQADLPMSLTLSVTGTQKDADRVADKDGDDIDQDSTIKDKVREEGKDKLIMGVLTFIDCGKCPDIANALWVAANTKKCPRCQTAIEKDEGCNHMNCRKCRKEFCWICMQDWTLHSDNTGGYFQCNRFIDNSNSLPIEGSNPNSALSSGGNGEVWIDERGNAQAEAVRSRERNRRMARFIHHFTRFQAHGESVKMESRMFTQTIKRVNESLLLSATGELQWLQGDKVEHPLIDLFSPAVTPLPQVSEKNAKASDHEQEDEDVSPLAAIIAATAREMEKEKGKKNEIISPPSPKPNFYSTPTKNNPENQPSERDQARENWKETLPQFSLKRKNKQLEFLHNGFEELLKCRHVSKWNSVIFVC
jgi:hypothetical protein